MPKTKDYEKLYKRLKEFVFNRLRHYEKQHQKLLAEYDGSTAKSQHIIKLNAKKDAIAVIVTFIKGVEEQ